MAQQLASLPTRAWPPVGTSWTADGFYLVPTKKRNCGTSPVRQLLDGIYSDACISSQLLLPADGFYLVPTKHNNCGTSPETGVAFTDIVDSQ
jgi:hypothetical protein